MKFVSLCIIVTVASLTFMIAGFILFVSVSDRHSNIRIAETFLEKLQASHAAAGNNPSEGNAPDAASAVLCTAEFAQDWNETSIVNFLEERNMETTYDYRNSLARKYKIPRYQGTASQNRRLLRALQKDLAMQCHSLSAAGVFR